MLLVLLWFVGGGDAAAEWHLATYVGGAHTHPSSVLVVQPGLDTRLLFRQVPFEGDSFEGPIYYGIRTGYFLNRHLGTDVEFVHLKVFSRVQETVQVAGTLRGAPFSGAIPMRTLVGRFSISHGVNLLLGNVVVRREFARRPAQKRGRLLLVGRLGAGGSISHPESEVLGVGDQHYEWGGPAIQLAGGVELQLWRGLYALAEYKFTHTRQHVRVVAGTAAVAFSTHHAVLGFAYHF